MQLEYARPGTRALDAEPVWQTKPCNALYRSVKPPEPQLGDLTQNVVVKSLECLEALSRPVKYANPSWRSCTCRTDTGQTHKKRKAQRTSAMSASESGLTSPSHADALTLSSSVGHLLSVWVAFGCCLDVAWVAWQAPAGCTWQHLRHVSPEAETQDRVK